MDKVKLIIDDIEFAPLIPGLQRKIATVDGEREISIYLTPEQIVQVFHHHAALIHDLRKEMEDQRMNICILHAKLNPPKFTSGVPTSDPHRSGGYGD
jgi:hypothetical protein